VYGMNFEFMPELKWKLGYFFSLLIMVLVVVVIYIWFRRKRII
jgi:magnesium transporter